MIEISAKAKELIEKNDLAVEDFTEEELAEVEAQIQADERGDDRLGGVEYRLFEAVYSRKIDRMLGQRE